MVGRAKRVPLISPHFSKRIWSPAFGGTDYFFRRGGGANQKQFCPMIERLLASFGKVRANHSACVKERSFLLRATSIRTTVWLFVNDSLAHHLLGQDPL